MWYAKMYFSEKKEVFQFDSYGVQGVPSTYKELPFLESLLSFLEMDCDELTPSLRRIAESWERLFQDGDREAGTATMVELGQLKSWHIYLELLYVRWYDRFSRIGADIPVSEQEDRQMLEELRSLPEQLPLYQRQVQRFFDLVLDVDQAGRDPQKQAAAHYLYDAPKDPELFVFHPIPLSFEPVELGRCSSVLYPLHISDMTTTPCAAVWSAGSPSGGARTAAAGSHRPAESVRSTVSAQWPPASRPAGRPGPFSSGPKSSPMIRCSRPTGRSTRSASPGSRPAVLPTSSSMPGANRPER